MASFTAVTLSFIITAHVLVEQNTGWPSKLNTFEDRNHDGTDRQYNGHKSCHEPSVTALSAVEVTPKTAVTNTEGG